MQETAGCGAFIGVVYASGTTGKDMDCPGCDRSCREVYCAKAMEKKIWRCPQKGCQNVVSLREGSYFSELQVKSEVIMRLIHLWVHKTSVGKAATKLGITDKVAIGWYNFNCEVCAHYFLDHPSVGVGGLKAIVSKNNTNLNFCINLCIISCIKEQYKFELLYHLVYNANFKFCIISSSFELCVIIMRHFKFCIILSSFILISFVVCVIIMRALVLIICHYYACIAQSHNG